MDIIKALAICRGVVKAHTLERTELMVSSIQPAALILAVSLQLQKMSNFTEVQKNQWYY